MSLKEEIQEDIKEAVRGKEELRSLVLRMVSAAIINKEKEKRYKVSKEEPNLKEEELVKKSQLTDEELILLISFEVKKRKDSVFEFEKGKRKDLADKEKKEIEILKKYLPEQISEEEIKKLTKEAIEKVGAESLKDMGKVMAELIPKVKGKADGGLVSKVVKELLIPKNK
ncbi:MAG: aspartyl-tRNA amidotransferase [Parcubacteria group bacterium]|nr:aspartyl-tRNA amidotransferase [Parcubacteria group bacterium]|tara:strand:- start:54484 stop:54993 length:510 start_codon:yes stop_codon:yes gene_type:complete